MAFFERKIRKARIKYKRRWWVTDGDVSHIEGRRFIFGDYLPSEPNLLTLWGTQRFYNSDPESAEGQAAWVEVCEIMGIKEERSGGVLPSGSGTFLMDGGEDNKKFTAYRSRNIEWWRPVNPEAK